MKTIFSLGSARRLRGPAAAFFICASLIGPHWLIAGTDTDKSVLPVGEEKSQDWVEFTLGGLILHGDHGQAQEQLHLSDNVQAGISDLHFQQSVGKSAILTIDGHAIPGNNDNLIKIDISQSGLGYFRAGYNQFCDWSDGNGGVFPSPTIGNVSFFPTQNVFALQRRSIFAEAGLRMPGLPDMTLRYERDSREGEEASTIWGDTTLTGLAAPNNTRKIVPAFEQINEVRDILTFDVKKPVDSWNTDFALGFRYERDDTNDSLNLSFNPNEPTQRLATQVDSLNGDMYTVHGDTETRLVADKLWFTTGYSYTTFNTDIGGSRIFGPTFGSVFDPTQTPTFSSAHGFVNLLGGSELGENVANTNLMWIPTDHLSLIFAMRFEDQQDENESSFTDTVLSTTGGKHYVLTPTLDHSSDDMTSVDGKFEARYTGLADWVFYARGEWQENQGTILDVEQSLVTAEINQAELMQKYTIGTNWYPCQKATASLQYFHRLDDNNYSFPSGVSVGYPGWLTAQNFTTDDLNVRLTLRPCGTVSLVSGYDFQQTQIDTQGFGLVLVESGETTSHIFSEAITWTPLDRLYLQTDFSYVACQTTTPATITVANPIPGVTGQLIGPENLNFQNNYWTLSFSAGYALDEKTNLQADYTFYQSDDFVNDALFTQPYGSGATEHMVSMKLTRQIKKNITASLKGGYVQYTDQTSAGLNNFSGPMVFTTLEVRF